MVPIRFVSETLGAVVDWDEKTKTIFITYFDFTYPIKISDLKKIAELDPDFTCSNVRPLSDGSFLIDGLYVETEELAVFYYDSKAQVLKKLLIQLNFGVGGPTFFLMTPFGLVVINRGGKTPIMYLKALI